MTVGDSAVFPLYISCNFLLHTPAADAADVYSDNAATSTSTDTANSAASAQHTASPVHVSGTS